jgi:hypothetical protein
MVGTTAGLMWRSDSSGSTQLQFAAELLIL